MQVHPIDSHTRTFKANAVWVAAAAALPFFIIASYFLVYCIHHDEHFQIMEFAHFKRGLSAGNKLAWEYDAQLRPTIQPALACIFLEALEVVGINDPFRQAFAFRMLSSLLFMYASVGLCKALIAEISSSFQRSVFIYLSLFLFMFPVSGVRYSSENISSCVFAIAFATLYPVLRNDERTTGSRLLITGMLLGLSFLFRYQSALLTFGLAAWLVVFRFHQIRKWTIIALSFLLTASAGVLIDRWFYGIWTCSAWNYLNFNIIQGKSAGFGVSPWHFYFSSMDWSKWPGIVNFYLLSGTILFKAVQFRHPVTWVFATFLLAHIAIPHKETRFLYPILIFVPFMVARSFDLLVTRRPRLAPLQPLLISVLAVNLVLFMMLTVSPIDNSIEVFRFIRTLPNKPVKIYFSGTLFHYTLRDSRKAIAPAFYYDHHHVTGVEKPITNLKALRETSFDSDTLSFVILDRWQQEELGSKYRPVFDPMPAFIHQINHRNWMKLGFNSWKLYQLEPGDYEKRANSKGTPRID